MTTKKTAAKKPAAAKPKATAKKTVKAKVSVKTIEVSIVKHAPEAGPGPNRQAKGWRNSQPIYED